MSFLLAQDGLASVKKRRKEVSYASKTAQRQHSIIQAEQRYLTQSPKRKTVRPSVGGLFERPAKEAATPTLTERISLKSCPRPDLAAFLALQEPPSPIETPVRRSESWNTELEDMWIQHVSEDEQIFTIIPPVSGVSTPTTVDISADFDSLSETSTLVDVEQVPEYVYEFNPLGYSCDQYAHHKYSELLIESDTLAGYTPRSALKQDEKCDLNVSNASSVSSTFCIFNDTTLETSLPRSIRVSRKRLFPSRLPQSTTQVSPIKTRSDAYPPVTLKYSQAHLARRYEPKTRDFAPVVKSDHSRDEHFFEAVNVAEAQLKIVRDKGIVLPYLDPSRDVTPVDSPSEDWQSSLMRNIGQWGSKRRNAKKLTAFSDDDVDAFILDSMKTSPRSPRSPVKPLNVLSQRLKPLTPIVKDASPFTALNNRNVSSPLTLHLQEFTTGLTKTYRSPDSHKSTPRRRSSRIVTPLGESHCN